MLVVISKGGDNAGKHTLSQTLDLAEQSNAITYTVGIFHPDDPVNNSSVLRQWATATGGGAYLPHDSAAVETICAQIPTDIRSRYMIAYAPSDPPKPGAYRTIQVVAKTPVAAS